MNLDDSLRDKVAVNGAFEDTAQLAQAVKFALRRGKNWEALQAESKEALELIATQIARILHGDHNEPEHWDRLAMFARLRGKALESVHRGAGDRIRDLAKAREAAGAAAMRLAQDEEE